MTQLYVLIACEESQVECAAFRALGHIAFSCDIQRCRPKGRPDWHICADVRPYLHGCTTFTTQAGEQLSVPRWDLIIAHPPCTYLSKVGSPWLYKDADTYITVNGRQYYINAARYRALLDARKFFMECLDADAPFLAVENPIPMNITRLPRPSTYACPSWFGDRYTKKTLYWLRNLPPLVAQIDNPRAKCLVHCSRGKYRSRTSALLAAAIARQWGNYILDIYAKQSL